jgi:steroid delta-isomerase-like uncharacterized protein
MEPLAVTQRYFDAWNRRDPDAIVATFAESGTYTDPAVPDGLTGPAIGAYAAGLFEAYPDLSFEIVSAAATGERTVAAQWLMRGTNTGPMAGNPPTGANVALPGADFIEVEGDRIRSVQGYFDQRALVEQLGLQVIVQPYALGPVTFGTSVGMQSGRRTRPGALSFTALEVRSQEEAEEVVRYSRQIMAEVARMPGFIGYMAMTLGQRMITVTAWEDADAPRPLLRGGTHKEAIVRFLGPDFTSGGSTTVWIPQRFNTLWVRCAACGRMEDAERRDGACSCGATLPEPPLLW